MRASIYQFFQILPGKLREDDKRLHMIWSFWLLLAAQFLWPAPWAFAVVFLIGFAKECWDSRFGSGFCFFDMFANIVGSSAALLLTLALPGTLFDS